MRKIVPRVVLIVCIATFFNPVGVRAADCGTPITEATIKNADGTFVARALLKMPSTNFDFAAKDGPLQVRSPSWTMGVVGMVQSKYVFGDNALEVVIRKDVTANYPYGWIDASVPQNIRQAIMFRKMVFGYALLIDPATLDGYTDGQTINAELKLMQYYNTRAEANPSGIVDLWAELGTAFAGNAGNPDGIWLGKPANAADEISCTATIAAPIAKELSEAKAANKLPTQDVGNVYDGDQHQTAAGRCGTPTSVGDSLRWAFCSMLDFFVQVLIGFVK